MSSQYYSRVRANKAKRALRKKKAFKKFQPRPMTTRRVKQIVKGMAEKKYKHLDYDTTFDQVGTFYPLANIAAGDAQEQREGDTIQVTRVDLHYRVTKADNSNTVRIIVFSKKGNAVPANLSEILESTSQYGIISEYNHERTYPFKVYYDKCVTVNADKDVSPVFNHSIPLNLRLKYTGVNATDYGDCNLWMVILSDSGAATHPSVIFRAITHYVDI